MNQPKKCIVFIDDDDGPILYYEQALYDSGFRVIRLKHFTKALDFIYSSTEQPDLWLIDVMMPIEDETLEIEGVNVVQSTSMGLSAGLVLYKEIKKRYGSIPVIVLTSIPTPQLLDKIEKTLSDGDTCESKLDTVPSQLIQLVKSRIS